MKSKVLTITLLASTTIIGHSNTSFAAPACYKVEGKVNTKNVTPNSQIGNIALELLDASNNVVFSNTGSLVGNITGTDGFGATLLSHVATFPEGDSFVTNNDKGVLAEPYVRKIVDGTPCSFWIHETVSNIVQGTKFFGNVGSANISADGYISNCPDENENEFELSGELCVK